MFGPRLGALAVLVGSASFAAGQARWDSDQVNTRICRWEQLRATVLRDTLYLDGGILWWQPGYANGTVGQPLYDHNPLGRMYTLNFSTPFNTTQNFTGVLDILQKPGGTNLSPNYIDGALLGNNEEFFLFGGMLQRTDAYSDPPGDMVLAYRRYQYGPVRDSFEPEFVNHHLGSNTTRYVAYGGAASAPSENLAWYFSGLQSASGGPIYTPTGANETTAAVNVSRGFITLDMEAQQRETFSNQTLPSRIPGRANPELVWVPVGPRGILVALGGVVFPDFADRFMMSPDEEASKEQSPTFMSTIDIYDVAGDKWYRQRTVGGPGQLARGCAVVATAQDRSSFNIYYYGGYDGLNAAEPFSDDVWVLSLPSFTWVNLAPGTDGRAGHKCVTPYPDQMLVIGGYQGGNIRGTLPCLRETVRVFNLSTGTWLDRYDPAVYSEYSVPEAVYEKIGGTGAGGATATTPSPSGWDEDELGSIFATPYPTSKITTYYPYASVGPTNNTNPEVPSDDSGDGGGVPSYLPPVLGTVLGVVFLTVVGVLILLWRRRRVLRGTMSEAGTEDTNGHRITSWLRGQLSEVKTPTVASTDYQPPSATDGDSVGVPPRSIAEMMNTEVQPIAELADTSSPAELHDNSVSQRGHLNGGAISASGTQHIDHAIPSHQPHPSPPPIPQDESPVFYRPDSDALGSRAPLPSSSSSPANSPGVASATGSPTAARENKVLSGVSNLSERDRAHLRQISETTVSSMTTTPGVGDRILSLESSIGGNGGGGGGGSGAAAAGLTVGHERLVESPAVLSPPAAGPGEGADLLSARRSSVPGSAGGSSPLRKSVFVERTEDMDAGKGEDDGGRKSG